MKRFLSLLMCLVMLGSMFPFASFAGAEGEPLPVRFVCDGAPVKATVFSAATGGFRHLHLTDEATEVPKSNSPKAIPLINSSGRIQTQDSLSPGPRKSAGYTESTLCS